MTEDERPRLTQGARDALKNYKTAVGYSVVHDAESNALKEKHDEITERDINKAINGFSRKKSVYKKYLINVCLVIVVALLISHFATFYLLENVSNLLLVPLYLPTISALIWILFVTYTFRDEL